MLSLFFVPFEKEKKLKQLTLSTVSSTFLLCLFLWLGFDNMTSKFQFVGFSSWISLSNINFVGGIDGISLFFVVLTSFVFPLGILSSWSLDKGDIRFYMLSFLSMELILFFVFMIIDLLFFYIFFEAILIPMFLVIGMFGSRERRVRAAYMFFLYTLAGSLLMLLGVIYVYLLTGCTNVESLFVTLIPHDTQKWLWLAFFASFAAKVPMMPLHIWLPEAHVEAPTAGSVVLASILLKLGAFGFLRFSLGIFFSASSFFTPFVFCLSLFGALYTSFTAIRQIDLKRLIAYTSIAHMNVIIIGLFTNTITGIEGAILQSLSHGFVSSGLFLVVGILYDRWKTKGILYFGGLVHTMPIFGIIFLLFSLANLGLPGTSSFVGEFFLLISTFEASTTVCVLVGFSMVLSAAYSLWVYNRITFGSSKTGGLDTRVREFVIFTPLIFGVLLMGIYPQYFLKNIHVFSYTVVG